MRDHAQRYGVDNIRLPKLGCGRDKLLWQQVRNLLIEVFQHTNLTLTVCVLPHRAPYAQ